MAEEEVWRDVVGYEGFYQVSNLGRVYGVPRKGKPKGGFIKISVRKADGYLIASLCTPDLGVKKKSVHILVARAFMGEPPVGHEVSHEDGNRANPRLSNLRYRTHVENLALTVAHGTKLLGEQVGNSVLKIDQVIEIRRRLAAGSERYVDIAEAFGVSKGAIQSISNQRTWKHLLPDHAN